MAGKIFDNAITPIGVSMGGSSMHNVERPGCLHVARIHVNMTATNALTPQEQKRVRAELENTPCEQCAKEKKHV